MRRRRHPEEETRANTGVSSRQVEEFMASLGPEPKKRKRGRSDGRRSFERAVAELRTMVDAKDFESARGGHLVALYAVLHEQVYGVSPAELFDGGSWFGATSAAERLAREEFNSPGAVVEFVRWVWQRERRAEQRRRTNGETDGRRIGWRLQFAMRHLLTDYRAELARARETTRPRHGNQDRSR